MDQEDLEPLPMDQENLEPPKRPATRTRRRRSPPNKRKRTKNQQLIINHEPLTPLGAATSTSASVPSPLGFDSDKQSQDPNQIVAVNPKKQMACKYALERKQNKALKKTAQRTLARSMLQKGTTVKKNEEISELKNRLRQLEAQQAQPYQKLDIKECASVLNEKLVSEDTEVKRSNITSLRNLQATLAVRISAYESEVMLGKEKKRNTITKYKSDSLKSIEAFIARHASTFWYLISFCC